MKLSVIVPAYNEGERICGNLGVVSEALSSFSSDYEIIAVNDGSKDNTAEEIVRASKSDPHIKPVIYEKNRGKGGAIIEGVRNATGDIIGFVDADLDLPPIMLKDFLNNMNTTGCDVVIGSKMHPDSKVDYPFARKVFSFCYFVMLKITAVQETKGFAFDIEQLALANKLGSKINEMPITLNFSRQESFGRIRIKDVLKMFTDTIKIWWKLRIVRRYDI